MIGTFATSEAAQQAGISVARFHHITRQLGIRPEWKMPGSRGAMLWSPDAIQAVTDHITTTPAPADRNPVRNIRPQPFDQQQ